MPFPHEGLRPVLDPSEPCADLLRCLAKPFELDAKIFQIFLKAAHPILRLSPGVALSPDHFPKHHPSRHALPSPTPQETREQYPSSANRHLNAFGICLDKRVGVG